MTRTIRIISIFLFTALLSSECLAEKPAHMTYPVKLMNLETGYVLGNGQSTRLGLGESGFGIGNTVQFTSNTLYDMLTLLNGQIKVRILSDDGPLPALSTGAAYYNLISAQYVTDIAVEEAFTEEETELTSGLDIFYWFVSVSKTVSPRVRLHAGYQHRYLSGDLQTDDPVVLDSDGESMGIEFDFSETATHRCLLFGADLDLLDHFKIMLELGRDFSYGKARGGAGFRLGIGGSFALQAGILWPGIKLDEDIDVPVLPHFNLFWRF